MSPEPSHDFKVLPLKGQIVNDHRVIHSRKWHPAWLLVLALFVVIPGVMSARFAAVYGYNGRTVLLTVLIYVTALSFFGAFAALGAIGLGAAAMVAFLLIGSLIFLASSLSNSAWGDNISYELAVSALRQYDVGLKLLLSSWQYALISIGAVLVGCVCLLILYRGAKALLRSTFGAGARSATVLTILVGGACTSIAGVWLSFDRTGLRGEPLSSFFLPTSIADMFGMDSARVVAAIEDIAAKSRYPIPAEPPTRNVVLILVDSLRADHMGVYGYDRETTPFLSRLFQEGMLHKVETALSCKKTRTDSWLCSARRCSSR